MKKYKIFNTAFTALFLSFCFTISAAANSSWVWISETRPYDVLPLVVLGTLLIETFTINMAAKINNTPKVFFAVVIGNILSFLAPYIIYGHFTEPYSSAGYSLEAILNSGPYYTVGTVFLIMTIIIELPFTYFYLKKSCENKKRLAAIIIAVNVLTTVLVAIIERLLCRGSW